MLSVQEKAERKTARAEARKVSKKQAIIDAEKNQMPVKEITISIEWKKSRTWGNNPHAEAAVTFQDGTFERVDGFTASGCGYDKESTVIGAIFNQFLKYKLWEFPFEVFKNGGTAFEQWGGHLPYGMHAYSPDSRSYGQGIGTNCYYRIAEAIGGKFECVASGKSFDVYKFTMNQEA